MSFGDVVESVKNYLTVQAAVQKAMAQLDVSFFVERTVAEYAIRSAEKAVSRDHEFAANPGLKKIFDANMNGSLARKIEEMKADYEARHPARAAAPIVRMTRPATDPNLEIDAAISLAFERLVTARNEHFDGVRRHLQSHPKLIPLVRERLMEGGHQSVVETLRIA